MINANEQSKVSPFVILWVLAYAAVLAWSAFAPKDFFTWFLEVVPALIGVLVLATTRKNFPLTPLAYVLVLGHCMILMVGGHYTYAEVPLFNWLRDSYHLGRNNYDKVGHFAQGFVPYILAREVFIRKSVVNGKGWLAFLAVCFCLGFSAFYELIEWWVAEFSGEGADAFLGTQGYVWDTQTEMFLALIGAVSAQFLLSKWHDRQIAQKLQLK